MNLALFLLGLTPECHKVTIIKFIRLVVLIVPIVADAQVVPLGPWSTLHGEITSDWKFVGTLPLFAINQHGANNTTQVIAIDSVSNYTKHSSEISSGLHATDGNWDFVDYGAGGNINDFYVGHGIAAIYRNIPEPPNCVPPECSTELHILDGITNYSTFKFHTKTLLRPADSNWSFGIDNGDLVAITRAGVQGTEVHVLNKDTGYKTFRFQTATALGPTDHDWEFGIVQNGDIAAIHKHSADNGFLEILILEKKSFYKHISRKIKTDLAINGPFWKFTAQHDRVLAINTNPVPGGKTSVYRIDIYNQQLGAAAIPDCICATSTGATLERINHGCPDYNSCASKCYSDAQSGLISSNNGLQIFCR